MRVGSLVMALWVAAAALLQPTPALAEQKPDKKTLQLIKQASEFYEKGDYVQAAETLIRAHDRQPITKLLYNIARAYEEGGDTDKAMRYYQRYIDAKDNDPTLMSKAANRMADLRENKLKQEYDEKQKLEDEKRKAEAERLRLEKRREELERKRKEELEARRRAEEESRQVNPVPIIGFSLLGLSAVGAASWTYFGASALMSRGDFDAASDLEQKRALADTVSFNALGADISWLSTLGLAAAGGALVAVGFLTGEKKPAQDKPGAASQPAAVPAATPQPAPQEPAQPAPAPAAES